MDFEKALKDKLKNKIMSSLNEFNCNFKEGNRLSFKTLEMMQSFKYIMDEYYLRKYKGQKTEEEIFEKTDEFESLFTDDKLYQIYHETNFTEEELLYIRYVKLCKEWRGYKSFDINEEYAIIDVLLRRIILQNFGYDGIDQLVKIMKEQLLKGNTSITPTCQYFMELLSDKPYGEHLKEKFEEKLEEQVNKDFNARINCGGYALKIDKCIFPLGRNKDFAQSVSTILENYPFVKLLGDRKLARDEYLVIYRANKDNTGHHFIRVDDDGVVREKNENGSPNVFEGWSEELKNSKEAIFAVKKNHEMFNYNMFDYENVVQTEKQGLNFNETIMKTIGEKKNLFFYHGHEFLLRKSSTGVNVMSDGNIVANIDTDGEECLIEITEGKEKYIENFSGKINPIIRNGHLVNKSDFISPKHFDNDER